MKTVQEWNELLGRSIEAEKNWHERAENVIEAYRAEDEQKVGEFNILWSNTEILKAALYAAQPTADVRRRNADRDPVSRMAAMVLERALDYCADRYDVFLPIEAAGEDALLTGRGVARVVFEQDEATREVEPLVQPYEGEVPEGAELDEMGMLSIPQEPEEYIAHQAVRIAYVYHKDFGRDPEARRWDDNRFIWFRHYMDRDEMERRGFDEADRIPLDHKAEGDDREKREADSAEVYEIWSKKDKAVIWLKKGWNKFLKVQRDPLGLENFYPCPQPLQPVTTTGSQVPIPEYTIYQEQAQELNRVTQRICSLTEALKRRGVYDGAYKEVLSQLQNASDSTFLPLDDWARFVNDGGLENVMMSEDIAPIAKVLEGLYAQRAQIIDTIYQITGISDIIRGATDPRETKGAQSLKAQFGSMRLKKRQDAVDRFVRELYRIKAELIAERFDPSILSEMTSIDVTPEVAEILRTDKLRGYKVDIETDATVFEDAEAEKASRLEAVRAIQEYLTSMAPLIAQAPSLGPLAKETMLFGIRTFKHARQLEDVIDRGLDEAIQQASQPRPDPEAEQAEREMALKEQEMQANIALKQQESQADLQMKQQEMQAQFMIDQARLRGELQVDQLAAMNDAQLAYFKAQLDAAIAAKQAESGEQ